MSGFVNNTNVLDERLTDVAEDNVAGSQIYVHEYSHDKSYSNLRGAYTFVPISHTESTIWDRIFWPTVVFTISTGIVLSIIFGWDILDELVKSFS